MKSLAERFEFHFAKEQDPREGNGWICNPFLPFKDDLNVKLEDKLLYLAGDEGLKIIFYCEITLAELWIKVRPEYPKLCEFALKVILLFPSTQLCEMGFSTMRIIKTKQRNALDARSPTCGTLLNRNKTR